MRLAILLLLVLPSYLLAQKPKTPVAAASPASKYGKSILLLADSAYRVANDIASRAFAAGADQATTSYSGKKVVALLSFRDTVRLAARTAQRLRDDFDGASRPPAALEKVHAQLLTALDSLTASVNLWQSALSRCQDANRENTESVFRCMEPSYAALDRSVAARGRYEDARERARRFLAEIGATMDSLKRS